MIVCICNNVAEHEIKKAIIEHEDVHCVKDLQQYINVCDSCHGCYTYLDKMIAQIDGGRTR